LIGKSGILQENSFQGVKKWTSAQISCDKKTRLQKRANIFAQKCSAQTRPKWIPTFDWARA